MLTASPWNPGHDSALDENDRETRGDDGPPIERETHTASSCVREEKKRPWEQASHAPRAFNRLRIVPVTNDVDRRDGRSTMRGPGPDNTRSSSSPSSQTGIVVDAAGGCQDENQFSTRRQPGPLAAPRPSGTSTTRHSPPISPPSALMWRRPLGLPPSPLGHASDIDRRAYTSPVVFLVAVLFQGGAARSGPRTRWPRRFS